MFNGLQKRLTNWAGRLKINGGRLGGTQDQPALEVIQDWNTSGKASLIKANVTTGVSGSDSKLLDLQVNGSSKFTVNADGLVSIKAYTGNSSNYNLKSLDSGFVVSSDAADLISIQSADFRFNSNYPLGFSTAPSSTANDVNLYRDAAATLAQRNGTNSQEFRLYGSYTSSSAYQRLSIKVLKESITVTGASTATSISIPKYSQLIGVTTRITTVLDTTNGTTGYMVGDGTDADLWGDITGTAAETTSDSNNFTAVDALGPDGANRTVTLTAKGGNFNGGVIEVCVFYLKAEAD